MSIKYKVLGKPGRDNAAYVWLNAGTKMYRFLLDCGESIFAGLSQGDIKSIDYLLLSHLHIDHIAGFDYYFRRNFDRQKTNYLWGPENTSTIIHHRLQGYMWNLIWQTPGDFIVTDINTDSLPATRFITSEGYKDTYKENYPFYFNAIDDITTLIDNKDFILKSALLNHSIPTVAYNITEKDSLNINKDELDNAALTPGNWLQTVRDIANPDDNMIIFNGKEFRLGYLRDKLLYSKKGESISYLTDFLFDEQSVNRATRLIRGSDTVICESQYHNDDIELASQNFHLTSRQAAALAAQAGVKKLILFHISERYYTSNNYISLLEDARTIFPETYFPDNWELKRIIH
jgi:ribonuclease Z